MCLDELCNSRGPAQTFTDSLSSEMVTTGQTFTWHVYPSTPPITAGRLGRDPLGPAQATIAMFNDPGVVPGENVYYPYSSTPARIAVPYETFDSWSTAPRRPTTTI